MIVKCEQCQTRFRIPDEKVTDRGVRVRCTKCQHTFRVSTSGILPVSAVGGGDEPAASAAMPPPPPPPSPSQSFLEDPFNEPTRIAPIPSMSETPAPAMDPVSEGAGFDPFAELGPAAPPPLPPAAARARPPPLPKPESLPPPEEPYESEAPVREDFGQAFGQAEGAGEEPDRSMFDLPAPPPPLPIPPPAPAVPSGKPLARISLSTVAVSQNGGPAAEYAPVQESGPAWAPPSDSAPALDIEGARKRVRSASVRRLMGLGANLTVFATLVVVLAAAGTVYVNDGVGPEGLSVRRVLETWGGSQGLEAVDVSNGLYETRSGRPVFFVRGDVLNRTQKTSHVRVRAEVLDGDQVIQSAEAFAGLLPSPEELYGLTGPEDVAVLTSRQEHGAKVVSPGAKAPFVVTFSQFPPELSAYRLRVQVLEGAPKGLATP